MTGCIGLCDSGCEICQYCNASCETACEANCQTCLTCQSCDACLSCDAGLGCGSCDYCNTCMSCDVLSDSLCGTQADVCQTVCQGCLIACQSCDTCQTCLSNNTVADEPEFEPFYKYDGGIDASWSAVTNAVSYTVEYKETSSSTWIAYTTTATLYSFTGLKYAVSHDFRVKANGATTSSGYATATGIYTIPKKPTISVGTKTSTTTQIRVNALPDNCDYVTVDCYRVENGYNYLHATNTINPTGSTFPSLQTTTFTGLNRTYGYVYSANSYYNTGSELLQSFLSNEVSDGDRPSNFTGFSGVASGANFNITATDWNNFCTKINEFRAYKGLDASTFTTVSSGQDFTAVVFNQAITAMQDLLFFFGFEQSIPPTQNVGQSIYASYFTDMKNALNSIV